MGYHATTVSSTLRLKSGAELARAWAEYAAGAPAEQGIPAEVPSDLPAFLGLYKVTPLVGSPDLFPESDKVSSPSHVHSRIECGAWRLFEPGGVLYLLGEDGEHFGFHITESGADSVVGIVRWVRDADLPDADGGDDDDEDERTETCARCAEDVPVDDIGPGQLCGWCTQLCR